MVYITAGFPAKIAYAIRLGASGDLTGTPNVAWKYEKGVAYVPSPILYGEHLYMLTDKGIMTALDAKTGKVVYEGGRVPVPSSFTASPVAYDGKILLTSGRRPPSSSRPAPHTRSSAPTRWLNRLRPRGHRRRQDFIAARRTCTPSAS